MNDEAIQYTPIGETISEIQNYIWDIICKETGNYQEKNVEPEMVNKQEFIEKACEWLEDKLRMYAGYSDTADLVDSFRKAMEE